MRARVLALTIFLLPATALAESDIAATCYTACETSTSSNPEYKACLARVADAADAKLNDGYKALQAAIRKGAKEMGQRSDIQLQSLTGAHKSGSPTGTRTAPSRTSLPLAASRLAGTTRPACAR